MYINSGLHFLQKNVYHKYNTHECGSFSIMTSKQLWYRRGTSRHIAGVAIAELAIAKLLGWNRIKQCKGVVVNRGVAEVFLFVVGAMRLCCIFPFSFLGRYLERFPSAAQWRSKRFLYQLVLQWWLIASGVKKEVVCYLRLGCRLPRVSTTMVSLISHWVEDAVARKYVEKYGLLRVWYKYQGSPCSSRRDIQANGLGQTAKFLLPTSGSVFFSFLMDWSVN